MYATETIQHFLVRARQRIDEALDQEANFWSQGELLEYLNEGARHVWQTARESQQNWFLRTMRSTDGVVDFNGRQYDPSALALTTGRSELALPPDFYQLVLFEPLPVSGDSRLPLVLEYANVTQKAFRRNAFDSFSDNVRYYRFDVEYRVEGPMLVLSPNVQLDQSVDTIIKYVQACRVFNIKSTFEYAGFTDIMTDAILAYVVYGASLKEKIQENMATAAQVWGAARELVMRAAGPKQTRDSETVEGFMEDEL
jgi:hypothetical protein